MSVSRGWQSLCEEHVGAGGHAGFLEARFLARDSADKRRESPTDGVRAERCREELQGTSVSGSIRPVWRRVPGRDAASTTPTGSAR